MQSPKVHNAFRKGLSELNVDLDQFACDIYFFFKLSSARREDYSDLEKITKLLLPIQLNKHQLDGFP